MIKKIRTFFGLCNHKWKWNGGMIVYYNFFLNKYVEYKRMYCEKCDTYKNK